MDCGARVWARLGEPFKSSDLQSWEVRWPCPCLVAPPSGCNSLSDRASLLQYGSAPGRWFHPQDMAPPLGSDLSRLAPPLGGSSTPRMWLHPSEVALPLYLAVHSSNLVTDSLSQPGRDPLHMMRVGPVQVRVVLGGPFPVPLYQGLSLVSGMSFPGWLLDSKLGGQSVLPPLGGHHPPNPLGASGVSALKTLPCPGSACSTFYFL